MFQSSPRILLLAAIFLSAIFSASITYAQSDFPATHVSLVLTRSVDDGDQAEAIALFNVDRASMSARFRISISRSSSPITRYMLVRNHRDGSTETLLSLPPQSGTLTEQGTVSGLSQEMLNVLDSGFLSLEIRSEKYPDKFMSGQITFAPNLITREFSAEQIDPRPEGATGDAQFFAILDPASRSLAYNITWSFLKSPPRELRFVRPGAGGDVVMHTITEFNGDSILVDRWSGMTSEDVEALSTGKAYALLTTENFPEGAIRGPINRVDVFTAVIDPAQPLPPATGSTAEGTGYLVLMDFPGMGYFMKSISAIHGTDQPVDDAHLHQGAFGSNGPEILALEHDSYFDGWEIEDNFQTSQIDPVALAMIRAGYSYLDFHSASYPDGELRGQLGPVPANLNPIPSSVAVPRPGVSASLTASFDPASSSIRYTLPNVSNHVSAYAILYSMSGARIGKFEVERGSEIIPAAGLANGLYMLQIIVGERSIGSCAVSIVR